jgi:hypothetical protein
MAGTGGAAMNHITMLDERLNRLGRELSGGGDLSEAIIRQLKTEGLATRQHPPAPPSRTKRRHWQAIAAVAAFLCVCLGIWWISRPQPLYARMLDALAKVQTVHATGWMTDIVRKWPLEMPLPNNSRPEKYEVEFWYWSDAAGVPCSYERTGPVTVIRRGGDLKEYQQDVDLTFIYEGGYDKDRVAQFERFAAYFSALERPSLEKVDLGTRDEGGRQLRGLRLVERGTAEEIWFDAKTDLPVQLTRSATRGGQKTLELNFATDEAVPRAIDRYEPPKSKLVRYGGGDEGRDEWLAHVAEIGEQLQKQSLNGRIAILPREDGRTFSLQYPLATPDGRYWVRPLDINQNIPMTLSQFVRDHAATSDGERRHGTWQLAQEFHDVELSRADLVYEADVPWQEWVQFVFNEFGFEFVEQKEEQTYWMARHDGRELKPWKQVNPPVPYVVEGGIEKKGYVRPGIGFKLRPATLADLFSDFNNMIDRDMRANKPWILDETGLPMPPGFDEREHGTHRRYAETVLPAFYVATDSPWFVDDQSVEMARKWFADEFGITFSEEVRPTVVHVIRPKSKREK